MRNTTRAVLRKLKRMKLRTVGISFVISLAMAMLVAGLYLGDTFDYTSDKFFEESNMPDAFYELAGPQNQTAVENALQSTPGIKEYDVRLKIGGVYDDEGADISVVLYGVKDPFRDEINKAVVAKGEKNQAPGEAVALSGMESSGIDAGEDIQVMVNNASLNLTITGLISSPEYLFPSAFAEYSIPLGGNLIVVFMDLDELQAVAGEGVNDVYVLLNDQGDVEEAGKALAPYGLKKTTLQEDHPSKVFMVVGAAKMRNMFPVIAGIFGVVGFISIFMTIYRIVKNDSRYIGVMMSLGYTRREITRSYLVLGMVLTIIGGIFGMILAFLFTQGIMQATIAMYPSMVLRFPFSPLPFIIGWIFIIGSVMLSVWIPVSMVTRTTVREALDYKPKMRVRANKKVGARLSRITTMGLRNSTRNPGRAALTIVVVGMTIGIAGSWLVMTDSAWGYMLEMIDSDEWDLRGDFAAPVDEADVLGNASFLGLQQSDIGASGRMITFSHMGGFAKKGSNSVGSMIVGCDEWKVAKEFRLESGKLDFNKAVVGTTMIKELDIELGDKITLDMGGNTITLEVAGIVYDMISPTVYTNKANLDPLFPSEKCTGVFLILQDRSDANIEAKAKDLQASPMVNNVVIQKNISEGISGVLEDSMGMLYAFFYINIIIAVVVAASAVIISTMERDVEFATLDTLGISKWRVGKSILVEMTVLSFGSALVGVPMAYLFGWLLAIVMAEVIFYFPIVFAIGATITTFAAGFAFVLLSSIVPFRYARKLDTEKTLRERTAG